jgi:hypothetical protein
MPQKWSADAILKVRLAYRGIAEMPENFKAASDQEIDELLSLLDTPVVAAGMSQDFRNVADWFAPAHTMNADLEAALAQTPFIPFKPSIASATIRRRGVKSAPRCFGSPFLFEPTEMDCRDCRFRDRCAPQATHQALGLVPGRRLPAPCPGHLVVGRHDKPERAQMRHHIRQRYLWRCKRSRKQYLVADTEYQRKRRARPDIAPIEREFRARLNALRRAVATSRHDKRLEQLRGREIGVARAWKAGQLARLSHGPAASYEKVACTYRTLIKGAASYSRDQACNDRRLIEKLENIEHVWGAFKKAAP